MSSKAPGPEVRSDGVARLTERERAVLRLLARGHDGKSAARALGISLTAVHERLREARRKLGVGSSREAARRLAEAEMDPEFRVDEVFGIGADDEPLSSSRRIQRRLALVWLGGLAMIGIAVGIVALWAVGTHDVGGSGPPPASTSPRVVRTSPAQGSMIAPGPFTLSVTFDRPMRPGNYSFVQTSPETYPDCQQPPVQSTDRRGYSLRCTAVAGRHYEIWFNSPPYLNFKSDSGIPAQPYQLLFRVKGR